MSATIKVRGITYEVRKTDLNVIAYKITCGKRTLDGLRNFYQKDVIAIMDNKGRCYGYFCESTLREIVKVS